MVSRKRGRAEMESSPQPIQEPGLLTRLRNMWEFANLMQYIFIFGKADLEAECLKSEPSDKLFEIGLALLKYVSSHRGLTPEIFDEYTRRQYVAKAPSRNPYGTDEEPAKFAEFDVFTKLRVLFQLSQWTLINADRMREKMLETKDTEQTQWRIEEVGYDKEDRLYFVLDDNRLYRRTDPALPATPPPPARKPKAKSKRGRAAARASKRRKIVETDDSTMSVDGTADGEIVVEGESKNKEADDGFGGRKWECIAINLTEYQDFLESIKKSRDVEEKALYSRLTKEVLPVIEKLEENRQKKLAKREKELMNMQKLATAKRSSRIATKQDKEREEREAAEAEYQRKVALIAAKRDQEKKKNLEEARESRMMTREQRLKEREFKRILHEEELASLSEDSKKLEKGEARMSERHLKAEVEKKKKELEKLAAEDQWDDGSHSVACEKCSVWQHSACLGISQAAAEKEDFAFVCDDCKRKEEDAKKPKIPTLKFRLGSSSSPPSDKINAMNGDAGGSVKRKSDDSKGDHRLPPSKKFKHVAVPPNGHESGSSNANGVNGMRNSIMNGPTLFPQGQIPQPDHYGNGSPPPPGLASPTRSTAFMNRVTHQNSTTNGHPPQTHTTPSYHSRLSNGQNPQEREVVESTRSDRYPPYYSAQLPTSNPFLNSFERQPPSAHHSTENLPSPMKNRPSMSPTQGNRNLGPLTYSNGTTLNGHVHTPIPSATHPDVYKPPAKHLNSSPPPPATSLQSSSPIMPPPTQQHRASLSGISPSKNSPPRPPSSHGVSMTPILSPATNLEPSPWAQDLSAPVKGMTPEQVRTSGMTNGH
ncbi:hypothetical protein MMC14_008186 [Varicellaria rhodocarpa]|nr:hypothetical protein [Varicellaria rhodocarpa]